MKKETNSTMKIKTEELEIFLNNLLKTIDERMQKEDKTKI